MMKRRAKPHGATGTGTAGARLGGFAMLLCLLLLTFPGTEGAAEAPVSFRSFNETDHYIRHRAFLGEIAPILSETDGLDASFRTVPGLADPAWRSFESVNYPGHHLRHRGFLLYIERGDGDLYRQDCTFRPVAR